MTRAGLLSAALSMSNVSSGAQEEDLLHEQTDGKSCAAAPKLGTVRMVAALKTQQIETIEST